MAAFSYFPKIEMERQADVHGLVGADLGAGETLFLAIGGAAAASTAGPHIAVAQTYPTRPVRLIVGYPAGGAADILARLIGQWLFTRLGQPFIVESRLGAGTNIATDAVVKSSADAYTLLLASPANAINATLYDNLTFNFIRDIAPVAGMLRAPLVMAVTPSLPARTVAEFIAYAKANSGKVNMASGGNGTPSHVAGELFKMMAGINMVHVVYRGAQPALTDVLAGQVEVMFADLPSAIGHIRSGTLRALAVTTAARTEALPDIPTIGDVIQGYEASTWFGVGAPRATPAELVATLNNEINAGLSDSTIAARIAELGGTPLMGSSGAFASLIADETVKWAKVIKFSGAKPA